MKAARLLAPQPRLKPSTDSFLLFDGDPQVGAERDPATGNWVIHIIERGRDRPEQVGDDAAFVDRLLDMAHAFAFPYASVVPEGWLDAVRPGVAAGRAWWEQHAALPYWQNGQAEGAP